jgi:isochorismate synthase
LPLQEEITTYVQHKSIPDKIDLSAHLENKKGFIMTPFHGKGTNSSYILVPDAVFVSDNIDPDFIQELSQKKDNHFIQQPFYTDIKTTPPEDFIRQVNDAKLCMTEGKFHKVVLSKVRVENLDEGFEACTFFLDLCDKYPHAFVYIIQLPETGCWIGATPEPLLVIEEGKVKTVSLAGTQVAGNKDIASYGWSEKEIEEQGIVTGFVEKTLRSLNIADLKQEGPVNYQAANLVHLKTSFEFNEIELGNRLGELIQGLHPTPSVGGLPKDAALEFILTNEKHDRSYYTGFLGPVNMDHKSSLFVNLRCLQLFQKQFVLYSGAGITVSSVAEKEWEETDNKMMTMQNVMKKQ